MIWNTYVNQILNTSAASPPGNLKNTLITHVYVYMYTYICIYIILYGCVTRNMDKTEKKVNSMRDRNKDIIYNWEKYKMIRNINTWRMGYQYFAYIL